MLSKKMSFSLMRLITITSLVIILALALVAPYAMAGEFSTDLTVDDSTDVSRAEGVQAQYGSLVNIRVRFGKVVNHNDNIAANATGDAGSGTDAFAKDDVEIIAYNNFGGTVTPPGLTATHYPAPTDPADGQNFTIQLAAVGTAAEDPNTDIVSVLVRIPKHVVYVADPRADLDEEGVKTADGKNAAGDITIHYVNIQSTLGSPVVHFIRRPGAFALPVTSETFDVVVQVSEEPKAGTFTKDRFSITNATITQVTALGAFDADAAFVSTGREGKVYKYLLTITPEYKNDNPDIVIKIGSFEDQEKPTSMKYTPPARDAGRTEGKDILTVKVGEEILEDVRAGVEVSVPADIVIPDVGDLSPAQSGGGDTTEAAATEIAAEKAKAEAAATAAAKAADTSVRIPEVGQIYISEIMFAGGSTLPQWIEISNGSRTEQVNLGGWTLTVENATADADVSVGAKAVFTIPEGTRIDPSGQHATPSTVLVITEQGRNNLDGRMAAGQLVNLWTDQRVELILLAISKRRYSLLSDMAFKITLAPPAALITTAAAADATDVVGNLGADGAATWALPMAEGHARSSIIRRHVAGSVGPAEPKDGEMMESWVLASDTNFGKPMHLRAHSYYGLPIDVGTPGFRAGGALPVELSHFRPARDKVTGAVVITWSTQSELNNAGFFIKRRQQRDGEFQIINATMIPGAGTTSEKQFYTYTDTTAQPNVVYYYQIEDVSLDGNHQTLTRGIRLKGHVSVAGKLTTLWGELKRTN